MSKKRVHEIAKEFGVESKQVISILQQHNFENITKAVNTVDDEGYNVVKQQLGKGSIKQAESKSNMQDNHKKNNHQQKQQGQKQDHKQDHKQDNKKQVRHV